jgi:hypothetical protein
LERRRTDKRDLLQDAAQGRDAAAQQIDGDRALRRGRTGDAGGGLRGS